MSVVKINAITVPTERADELGGTLRGPRRRGVGLARLRGLRAAPPDRRPRHRSSCTRAGAREEDFQAWVQQPRLPARPQGAQRAGPGEHAQRAVAVRRRPARGARRCTSACALQSDPVRLPQGLGLRRDRRERARRARRPGRLARRRAAGPVGVDRCTIVAEAAMMLQVLVGTILVVEQGLHRAPVPHVLRLPRVPHRRHRVPVPRRRCADAARCSTGSSGCS